MALFRAQVKVRLKKGVADPEGANAKKALELLGFSGISEMHSVKYFEMALTARDQKDAKGKLDEMCRRLLANPVIHNYSVEIEKA